MVDKYWIATVRNTLEQSLSPVPHEVNELDWKVSLSEHKEKLVTHLIAFANYANGGAFVFGVADSGELVGVDQTDVASIINSLANLGRDAVEPPLALDHAVVNVNGVSILLVHVPEQAVKPVHRRGKTIEEAWVRSGGTTRKASRQEVGALMLNSTTLRWEELQQACPEWPGFRPERRSESLRAELERQLAEEA